MMRFIGLSFDDLLMHTTHNTIVVAKGAVGYECPVKQWIYLPTYLPTHLQVAECRESISLSRNSVYVSQGHELSACQIYI